MRILCFNSEGALRAYIAGLDAMKESLSDMSLDELQDVLPLAEYGGR